MKIYIVATIGILNAAFFEREIKSLPGQWFLVQSPAELDHLLGDGIEPAFIFFPHWRWKVPEKIVQEFNCVCFHMTDLPYGRGGSPLQNLILEGCQDTKLTALKMDAGLDSGPIYFKYHLSLSGTASDILERAAVLIWQGIRKLVFDENIKPIPQRGNVTIFKRRSPSESELPPDMEPSYIFDFIRMLDSPDYPRAFLNVGSYQLTFSDARLSGNQVLASVSISVRGQ